MTTLSGRRVLIVEDEYLLATDLALEVERRGGVVIGPAPSPTAAMKLVAAAPAIDVAILDINLNGEMVFDFADELDRRGIHFMLASGYDANDIPKRFANIKRCRKPYSPAEVIDMLLTH